MRSRRENWEKHQGFHGDKDKICIVPIPLCPSTPFSGMQWYPGHHIQSSTCWQCPQAAMPKGLL